MTIDLNELERLANACFVGPWKAETWGVEYPSETDPHVIAQIYSTHGGKIHTFGFKRFAKTHAEFIAAARTAVPELIARVRWLEAKYKKLARASSLSLDYEIDRRARGEADAERLRAENVRLREAVANASDFISTIGSDSDEVQIALLAELRTLVGEGGVS